MRRACEGCNGALVLEAARANGDIVSARKGNAWYTLTAQGRSAHAGVEPEKGRNAILEIAHQALQLASINGWREGISINAGSISGGTAPNVVPEAAMARLDLRFLRTEDRLATEARWHELLKKHYIAEVETTLMLEPDPRNPMTLTSASQKIAATAKDIVATLGLSLHDTTTGGANRDTLLRMFMELKKQKEPNETEIQATELELIAFTLASLVLRKNNVDLQWLIRRFQEMHDIIREAPIYQEILREGREEGIEEGREASIHILLMSTQALFPSLVTLLQKQITSIKDLKTLEELASKILSAKTVDEARAYIVGGQEKKFDA